MKPFRLNDPLAPSLSERLIAARVDRVVCSATPEEEGRTVRSTSPIAIDRHGQCEMLFVLEGRSTFLYRDRLWGLSPGTLVAIAPWETHAFGYGPRDNGLLHLWLRLRPDQITGSCIGVEGGRMRPAENFAAITGTPCVYLSRRWADAAAESDAPVQAATLRHVCESALLEFALGFRKRGEPRDVASETAAFVEDYIARQHGRDCSLAKLERLTGYSRFHLSRLFHRQCGMTIGQAINASRLNFLADAESQGLKQRSIAEALGFASPSAFCLWKRRRSLLR